MAKFSSPKKQAATAVKIMKSAGQKSLGTLRNYEQSLTRVANYMNTQGNTNLQSLSVKEAFEYLENRRSEIGQKTLDMDRLAIQALFHLVSGILPLDQKLNFVVSLQPQILFSRAYTPGQITLISNAQTPRNKLATNIASFSGCRAHELFTLMRSEDRPPDHRPNDPGKWDARVGVLYTVVGKGGLVREVLLSHKLAIELEETRLRTPITVTDRKITYKSHFQLSGGQKWSNSFSQASKRVLGKSMGAHGTRHSYAQSRLKELQKFGP